MARAATVTAVSLDQLADIYEIHPILFNSLNGEGLMMYGQDTRPVQWQRNWQAHDMLGRSAIANAVYQAERNFIRELTWPITPTMFVNEKCFDVRLWEEPHFLTSISRQESFGSTNAGRCLLALRWGQIIAGGIEVTTTVSSSASLTCSEPNRLSINETWTVTVPTTATNPDEIHVYYAAADRLTSDVASWEIRPLDITISGGNAVIVGKRWQVVDPALQEVVSPEAYQGIEYSDDSNFVTAVEVRRIRLDTTQPHVTFYWRDGTTQTGFIEVEGNYHVVPYVGTYNTTTGVWDKLPFTYSRNEDLRYLTVTYQAGLPLVNGRVEQEVAQLIAQFATGFMSENMGNVIPTETQFNYWREDMARNAQILPYNADEFRNPLGAWRGAMEAWRYIIRQDRRSV